MSLSDTFGDGTALVGALQGMIRTDGLQDLLAGFNDVGAEEQVQSWQGSVANQPVDAGDVKRAVGHGRIEAMAADLGATPDEVAEGLARIIPPAVDVLTPGGRLPSGKQLDTIDLARELAGTDIRTLLR